MKIAFIIGSPRSGTTILGNILNHHPEIAEWYEPYYLWEKYFPCKTDDIWLEEHLNKEIKERILKEYRIFLRKAKKSVVLEKSPGHELNMGIIHKIFQDAKWIHLLRDGRDVTLSINKEWILRSQLVKNKDFARLFKVAWNMLKRQPFWRYRIMAVLYELQSTFSLNPVRYLNKSRWQGKEGWGNRFRGWKGYLRMHSTLEFNAMQWIKSVEAVQDYWSILPEKNRIEIKYEDLLGSPEKTLGRIFKILEVDTPAGFFDEIPTLKKNNFHKWSKEFKKEQLTEISPILTEKLLYLGYENDTNWANAAAGREKGN
jgi:hypothetical protein